MRNGDNGDHISQYRLGYFSKLVRDFFGRQIDMRSAFFHPVFRSRHFER
jgi:hypothetical protein